MWPHAPGDLRARVLPEGKAQQAGAVDREVPGEGRTGRPSVASASIRRPQPVAHAAAADDHGGAEGYRPQAVLRGP
eukprot:7347407-Alexandrium_andersonii.AAC.1